MIIDGRKIARDIKNGLREKIEVFEHAPVLAIVVVGEDPVIESFVRIKKHFARDIGVHIEEHRFSDTIGTDTLLGKMEELVLDPSVHGIVVQLPLPKHIDSETILGALPADKDVDVLSAENMALFAADRSRIIPPVVGAMKKVIEDQHVVVAGKSVVVIGHGRLVGKPAAVWFKKMGAQVTVVTKGDTDMLYAVKNADILVLGAGVPSLIKQDMIKKGVVILDAGTSEEAGKLAGDADPLCANTCSVMTPVPGGIGPITVAALFENLFELFREDGNRV